MMLSGLFSSTVEQSARQLWTLRTELFRFIMYIIQSPRTRGWMRGRGRGRRGEVTTFMDGQEGAVECHASFI